MIPVGKRLVIKRDDNEGKTDSGIILGTAAEKPATGTVMFNGPEAKQVFAGNKVIFMKFAGTEVSYDGEDLLIMKEEDVLAIVDG
jgi:chaperonin GroES